MTRILVVMRETSLLPLGSTITTTARRTRFTKLFTQGLPAVPFCTYPLV